MGLLLLISIAESSFIYQENSPEVDYIKSSFKNDPDVLKLFEYVKDNIFEHGNSSNGYISVSMLPFPMDLIDVKKFNELYNHSDNNLAPIVKFCMDKGYTPHIYGYYRYGSEEVICNSPKIQDGFVYYGFDETGQIMNADVMLFDRDLGHNTYMPTYLPITFISSLQKWGKIAISRPYNEQAYIDYFISNDFPLNRLRKILVSLIKDLAKLYSRQIDEKENVERLIEYNFLLQKYCAKLIEHCEKYLKIQAGNQKVSLTL